MPRMALFKFNTIGNVMETVKIQHFSTNKHPVNGSLTIATILSAEENVIEYGVAYCSVKDRFVKKTGTELATKRVEAFRETGVYDMSGMAIVPPLATRNEILFAVFSAIAGANQMPAWARPLVIENVIDYSFKANDNHHELSKFRKQLLFKK